MYFCNYITLKGHVYALRGKLYYNIESKSTERTLNIISYSLAKNHMFKPLLGNYINKSWIQIYFVNRLATLKPNKANELFSYPSGENSRLNTPPVGSEFACSQSHEAIGFMPQYKLRARASPAPKGVPKPVSRRINRYGLKAEYLAINDELSVLPYTKSMVLSIVIITSRYIDE